MKRLICLVWGCDWQDVYKVNDTSFRDEITLFPSKSITYLVGKRCSRCHRFVEDWKSMSQSVVVKPGSKSGLNQLVDDKLKEVKEMYE